MAEPHYMIPRRPIVPPEILAKPDTASIHKHRLAPEYAQVQTKFMDPPPEKRQSDFIPLDRTEGVRFDDDVLAIKEFAAKVGYGDVPSRFEEDMLAKVQHAEGTSPRDVSRERIRQRLGIHDCSFRPVSSQATKTFDDYATMAKVWRAQHGLSEDSEARSSARKIDRPSVIGEYIASNAPILARSGEPLTSVRRDRREQIRAHAKPEPHLVASYFADGFSRGPGSDDPAPVFRNAKAAFLREREVVTRLVDRLKGKGSYSPQRMDGLAAPLTPAMRAARAMEAERSHSRHADPHSPSPTSSRQQQAADLEGPQRPRYWR